MSGRVRDMFSRGTSCVVLLKKHIVYNGHYFGNSSECRSKRAYMAQNNTLRDYFSKRDRVCLLSFIHISPEFSTLLCIVDQENGARFGKALDEERVRRSGRGSLCLLRSVS